MVKCFTFTQKKFVWASRLSWQNGLLLLAPDANLRQKPAFASGSGLGCRTAFITLHLQIRSIYQNVNMQSEGLLLWLMNTADVGLSLRFPRQSLDLQLKTHRPCLFLHQYMLWLDLHTHEPRYFMACCQATEERKWAPRPDRSLLKRGPSKARIYLLDNGPISPSLIPEPRKINFAQRTLFL